MSRADADTKRYILGRRVNSHQLTRHAHNTSVSAFLCERARNVSDQSTFSNSNLKELVVFEVRVSQLLHQDVKISPGC